MKRRASLHASLILAVAACGPAASTSAPPETAAQTRDAGAAPPSTTDATCGGKLTPRNDAPEIAKVRTERTLPLALLVADSPKLRVVRAGAPLELGDVSVTVRSHPRTGIDMGRLYLRPEVPRATLPAPVAAQWDAWYAAIDSRREALTRRAIAQGELDRCPDCAAHACLASAVEHATHDADTVKSAMTKESDALVSLLEPLAKDSAAPAGVLVADAWLLEQRARQDETNEDIAPRLKASIELYARAEKSAPASDPLGLAARYHRAAALEDAGLTVDARALWRELSEIASAVRAEAFFRVGSLEDDPALALAAFASARDADTSKAKLIAYGSMFRALGVAEDANRPRDLLDIATRLSVNPDADDETSSAIARAIDGLGGELPDGLKVSVTVFAKAAMVSADLADERADRERAERLRRAVVANASGSKEADDATKALSNPSPAPTDTEALRARLRALARSCRTTTEDAQIEVRGTKAGVTIVAENTGERDFQPCFAARKNWFLAASKPWPDFHARIVF